MQNGPPIQGGRFLCKAIQEHSEPAAYGYKDFAMVGIAS
jgi:hypothetical protein